MRLIAKRYAELFITAFESGEDSQVIDLCKELDEDNSIYLEVWGFLPSTMRRQIKVILERENERLEKGYG